jgi:hypothetical protein
MTFVSLLYLKPLQVRSIASVAELVDALDLKCLLYPLKGSLRLIFHDLDSK